MSNDSPCLPSCSKRLSDEKNRLEHGLRERLRELTEQCRLEQVRYHCKASAVQDEVTHSGGRLCLLLLRLTLSCCATCTQVACQEGVAREQLLQDRVSHKRQQCMPILFQSACKVSSRLLHFGND